MNTNQNKPINRPNGIIGSFGELFRRPFPVMDDWEMRWVVIGFHGIFVVAFLLLFQPFQNIFSPGSPLVNAGFGLVVSLVLAINDILIWKIFQINLKNWTIGNSILWTLYDVVAVILGVFIYKNYWTGFENLTWKGLLNIGSVTLLIAIIPVMISTILLENWLLRRNLLKASQMQQSVDSAASANRDAKEELLTLFSENKSEWIKIHPSSLIYLESADNYVNVIYQENEETQKKLLRSTLTNIETQITPAYIQRCHRSYMINLHKIKYVNGNSRGLQLQLLGIGMTVPVSRKYVKIILSQIETGEG